MPTTHDAHDEAITPHIDRLRAEMRDEMDAEMGDDLGTDLGEIEMGVLTEGYTLADAIREGATVSEQAHNWGDEDTACAMTAAYVAAKARGVI